MADLIVSSGSAFRPRPGPGILAQPYYGDPTDEPSYGPGFRVIGSPMESNPPLRPGISPDYANTPGNDSPTRYSGVLDDYYTGLQNNHQANKPLLSPFQHWWMGRHPDGAKPTAEAEFQYHQDFGNTPEFQIMQRLYDTMRGVGTSPRTGQPPPEYNGPSYQDLSKNFNPQPGTPGFQ